VLAELGLAGLAAFLALVAGVALAGRRALKTSPALAAGPVAATLAWFLHASIDWDWQLPAVTLPALVLAGALLALSESPPPARRRGPAAAARRAPAAPSRRPGRA
jgi:hypothetical protein